MDRVAFVTERLSILQSYLDFDYLYFQKAKPEAVKEIDFWLYKGFQLYKG